MNASTLPNVGTKVIVTFRTDGNCKLIFNKGYS